MYSNKKLYQKVLLYKMDKSVIKRINLASGKTYRISSVPIMCDRRKKIP